MSMKINKLEIENVKRIRAVKLEPTANGLTIIGGKNNQGKTSVLDSIAWALGGETFRPSEATREGSVIPPNLKIVMNNGLVVERKGKNSALKVTDPSGQKAGQQLLGGGGRVPLVRLVCRQDLTGVHVREDPGLCSGLRCGGAVRQGTGVVDGCLRGRLTGLGQRRRARHEHRECGSEETGEKGPQRRARRASA